MGEARQFWPVSKCQMGVPVLASKAVKVPPERPMKRSLPAVASRPVPPKPPAVKGNSQAFAPVRMSIARMVVWPPGPREPKEPPKKRCPIWGGVGSLRGAAQLSERRTNIHFKDGSRAVDDH